MRVKIEHKNRKLETVNIEEFELDMYCQKLSQDLTGLLSDLEYFLSNYSEENEVELSDYYKKIRHKIFDIAGSVKRLPDNIIEEEIEDIKLDEINSGKLTLSKLFTILGFQK